MYPGEIDDLKCPDCGARMRLRPSKHGLFYSCSRFPYCRGTHGAHPDGAPLGVPADREWAKRREAGRRAVTTPAERFRRTNNRYCAEPFALLPKSILRSPQFQALSGNATKLFIQVLGDYNGSNNGDFQITAKTYRDRGWVSNATLENARNELLRTGFLEMTRQGGRNQASLYAVTIYSREHTTTRETVHAEEDR